MVSWGHESYGGDCSAVHKQLPELIVKRVYFDWSLQGVCRYVCLHLICIERDTHTYAGTHIYIGLSVYFVHTLPYYPIPDYTTLHYTMLYYTILYVFGDYTAIAAIFQLFRPDAGS